MFIQSAFIRKNSNSLKKQLSEIGYDVSEIKDSSECIATSSVLGKAVGISESSFDYNNPHSTWNCSNRIDCGNNEELFLAICALNDNTDKNQWFVLDSNVGSVNFPESMIMKGELVKCLKDKWFIDNNDNDESSPLFLTSRNWPSHKATVEELLEYFHQK